MAINLGSDDYEIVDQPGAPLLAEFVAYWERKRGDRWAPRRADIDPGELAQHLPHIFMLDVLEGGKDFRFRLIGTAIVDGVGRDSTGRCFSELFADQPDVLARLIARFDHVVHDKAPSFSRGRVFWQKERRHRRFAAASVPLSDGRDKVGIIRRAWQWPPMEKKGVG